MALKRYENGTFEITNLKQAREAYELMQELSDSILELERENGITEMRQDAVGLKQSADAFLVKRREALELPGIGKVAKVIRGYDGLWIGTKSDLQKLDSVPQGVKPLRSIVGKDIWKRITKRVLDPEKLAEAVATGEVKEDEIEKAYVQKPRSPYVRLYNEEDEDE